VYFWADKMYTRGLLFFENICGPERSAGFKGKVSAITVRRGHILKYLGCLVIFLV
jgi:hypothetical protein